MNCHFGEPVKNPPSPPLVKGGGGDLCSEFVYRSDRFVIALLSELEQILYLLSEHHVPGELELAAHESLDGIDLLVHNAKPRVARHGQGHGGSAVFPILHLAGAVLHVHIP